MGSISYIKNFLQDRKVASITPTSRFTIDRVCKHIDLSKNIRIIEYGPGDGVFTKVLLKNITDGSQILAVETNKNFAEELSSLEDDRLTVRHDSAEHVDKITGSLKWESVDYIISGIPFSFLEDEVKHVILEKSANLLKNGGRFLGYQTSAHLKPFLSDHFEKVSTEMEYLNIPPMCIYVADK